MPDDTPYTYAGSELGTFADARNWKRYVRSHVEPYISGRVLEVGAGIGATTEVLAPGSGTGPWVCLEPDPKLVDALQTRAGEGRLPTATEVIQGTVADLIGRRFDTVLYMDVLEHILDDRSEVEAASRLLEPEGHLVVLCPAHGWLFSPFDEAIGHHRRYTRNSLEALTPPDLTVAESKYLDAAGLIASLANRLLLRSADPSPRQVRFWDRILVPISRRADRLLGYRLGKSVLVIWKRG